jgi:hypothetical protein
MTNNLLARLIEKRDRLDAAIEVLREETGERLQKRAYRKAGRALQHTNGGAPPAEAAPVPKAKTRRPLTPNQRKYNHPDSPYRGTNREIETIAVPPGVNFEGVSFDKAAELAIRAVGVAIPTPELTLLLENAGVKFPKISMPRRRYVGMVAARLVSAGAVKRTDTGWQAKPERKQK